MKDEGVSSVVAAVLIFSLFSTAFLMWTFNTMPEWVADREHEHLLGVQEDLANLQSGLERLSAAEESGPVTQSIRLAADPIQLLQATSNAGQLSLGDDIRMQTSFTGASIHAIDGQGIGLPTATPTGAVEATNVAELRALELKLSTSGVTDADAYAGIQLVASDGADTTSVLLRHGGSNIAPGCGTDKSISILVTLPDGSTRNTAILCTGAEAVDGQTVDVLAGDYGFKAALSRLDSDMTLDLSLVSANAADAGSTYNAVWTDTDGRPGVAGNGVAAPDYAPDLTSRFLRFQSNAQRFPSQDLFWEGGAVVVEQAQGTSMVRAPGIRLAQDAGTGYLRWTFTELDGQGGAGGDGTGLAELTHGSTETTLLTATGGTFTITSERAAAWRSFLADEVLLSGADATVGGTGNTATLTLSNATTTWIIELRVLHGDLTIS